MKPKHSIKIIYPIDRDEVNEFFTLRDTINRFFRRLPYVAGVCAIVLTVIGAYILAVKFMM